MKVLLIDDEVDIRTIIRISLTKIGGMSVLEASGGAEGLRLAEAELPDVILLDIMMPGIDGPSTLAALRLNPATAKIPVIFLTAKALQNEIEQLKGLGARGVLTKPFVPQELPDLVRNLLKSEKAA